MCRALSSQLRKSSCADGDSPQVTAKAVNCVTPGVGTPLMHAIHKRDENSIVMVKANIAAAAEVPVSCSPIKEEHLLDADAGGDQRKPM